MALPEGPCSPPGGWSDRPPHDGPATKTLVRRLAVGRPGRPPDGPATKSLVRRPAVRRRGPLVHRDGRLRRRRHGADRAPRGGDPPADVRRSRPRDGGRSARPHRPHRRRLRCSRRRRRPGWWLSLRRPVGSAPRVRAVPRAGREIACRRGRSGRRRGRGRRSGRRRWCQSGRREWWRRERSGRRRRDGRRRRRGRRRSAGRGPACREGPGADSPRRDQVTQVRERRRPERGEEPLQQEGPRRRRQVRVRRGRPHGEDWQSQGGVPCARARQGRGRRGETAGRPRRSGEMRPHLPQEPQRRHPDSGPHGRDDPLQPEARRKNSKHRERESWGARQRSRCTRSPPNASPWQSPASRPRSNSPWTARYAAALPHALRVASS